MSKKDKSTDKPKEKAKKHNHDGQGKEEIANAIIPVEAGCCDEGR